MVGALTEWRVGRHSSSLPPLPHTHTGLSAYRDPAPLASAYLTLGAHTRVALSAIDMSSSMYTRGRKNRNLALEKAKRDKEIEELKSAKDTLDAIFKAPETGKSPIEVSPVPQKKVAKKKKKAKTDEARMEKVEAQLAQLTALMTKHVINAVLALTSQTSLPQQLRPPASTALAAMLPPPPLPALAATAPTPVQATGTHQRPAHIPLPPQAMLEHPHVATHSFKSLEPSMGVTGGKRNNIYRPYMFILSRFRSKKQVEQEDLSFPLYVNGMTGIILNAFSDRASRPASVCRHLREVAEDVADKRLESVRRWTKTIFDQLDTGELSWEAYEEIQRERMKLSYTAPQCSALSPYAYHTISRSALRWIHVTG